MILKLISRAAVSVVGPFCVFAAVAISAPTFAESPTGLNAATLGAATMLASVTPAAIDSGQVVEPRFATPEGDQTLPEVDATDSDAQADVQSTAPSAATLAALVADRLTADTLDEEHECLAVSVYFESQGEPLAGQLAVAQTLLNRTRSGRFPTSLCGVVRQHGQFSFVHDGALPAVPRGSRAWREAVAIASIARDGLWKATAPGALFFHASRVSPGWSHVTRIAQLGNHIFYR